MLEFDPSFSHSYRVEEVGEFPGTGKFNAPVFFIPTPKLHREHNGLWLRVIPSSGKTWIGVFAFDHASRAGISRVLSSPQANRVCVISGGNAFVVNVDNPEQWEKIPAMPALDVRSIPQLGLLIFTDFTGLTAYGISGLAWCSPRVCCDGLKITNISEDAIEGTGYDPRNSSNRESRFVVDPKTGRSLLDMHFRADE